MGFLHYGCFPAVAPKAAVQAEVASCELRALKISKVGGRSFSPSQNLMLPFEKRLAVTHLEPKWLGGYIAARLRKCGRGGGHRADMGDP